MKTSSVTLPAPPTRSLADYRRGFARGRSTHRALRIAAEAGDAGAQFNLGIVYANQSDDSRGSELDRAEAVEWLSRAADQGLLRAQRKLADIYSVESMGPRAHVKSCAWLLIATAQSTGALGDDALAAFNRVSSRLTLPQVELAKRLARRWRPKQPATEGDTPSAPRSQG